LTPPITPILDDTIAALATPAGAGRRAIVRLSGPLCETVALALCGRIPSHGRFESVGLQLTGLARPLPGFILFRRGPRTYTGQDVLELHTVSSAPLVELLLEDVLRLGARAARPGEFTQRAFLAGKKDLPRAEAVLAVIEASTDEDLKPALAQLAGGVSRPLDQMRSDLLDLLADVEAALDFADEHLEFVPKTAILNRITAALAHLANLKRQVDDRRMAGRAVRVVLAGAPNAGKSTLFNALLGEHRALVNARAGTTRDYLTANLTLGGVAVELIDTAGWAAATDSVEQEAQTLGREQATRADVVVWCAAPGDTFTGEVSFQRQAVVLRASTQADRMDHPLAFGGIPTSAVTPGGLDALRMELTHAVERAARPPLAPSLTRCKHHVEQATRALRSAHSVALNDDPPELLAAELRVALNHIGETAGTVHTPDLLDRIFSRFCIGK
jgi:tRNA modification GTPase